MTKIGTIELLASIDTTRYKSGATVITATNKELEKSTDSSTKRSSESWNKFVVAAKAASLASSAAIVAGFTKSVIAVANLEQSLGGSEVVFANYAKEVQNIARDSYRTMGTSTRQYLDTANKMGSLFQGAGFSVQESMKLSTEAMQRATDVATAMGISTDMALESIAGAAKGNFTMMDNLGVAMNDTTLEAYRLEKGLDKAVTKMTTSEKVGLAMQLFMERTAKYAGNYAKENDTLAGSFQTLKGSMENFMAGVEGSDKALVESSKNMSRVLGREVPKIASNLIRGIGGIYEGLKEASPEFNNAAKMGERLFMVISTLVSIALKLSPLIIGITVGVIAWRSAIAIASAITAAYNAVLAVTGYRYVMLNGQLVLMRASLSAAAVGQAALNTVMSLNPIALVIGLVAGLVTVLGLLFFSTNDNKSATDSLNAVRKEQIRLADEARNAENMLRDANLGVQRASLNVEAATRSYNEAVSTYGKNSLEARQAALGLKDANIELEDKTRSLNDTLASQMVTLDGVNRKLDNLNGKSVTYTVNGRSVMEWEQNGQRFFGGGFATGGYTGRGGVNEVAGVVHRGEYVIPQKHVDQNTGLPKFQSSKPTTQYNINQITISSEVDGERWLRRLTNNQEITSAGLVPQQRYMG